MAKTVRSAWLMKAEPETRIVKDQDVAFSATDFEKAGVEHWDGVRNHEAKNLMKDKMKIGDPVLFYHSNCKTPGIAAIAEVHKAGYPDFTAFDPSHPYYDPKSSESSPTWYMVDVKFISHLTHFVSLKTLQALASHPPPKVVPDYLTPEKIQAIREMPLLNRGRLSVQPVSLEAFEAIKCLGERGGVVETSGPKRRNAFLSPTERSKRLKPVSDPDTSRPSIKSNSRPKRGSKVGKE
ncbi:hypothetical protein CROQUDRAFT_44039 [Cronartium quercuum f. sp. fusiforme G11]|uniref:EVE domain-containing protein n=1 Tax=Cronartium quercuum f. sp. fusiforme G11 TaxID=708437 RepID=A0A9P6TBV9_9BASI|nr:hypothetical protein CROQUDRAFT_44039 [Cronartium quercuum f. sp. fusiforme G11]